MRRASGPQREFARAPAAATLGAFLALGILTFVLLSAAAKKHPPARPLDLNSATIEQFEQLPGIGPTTARRIVQFREKSGPFRRVEDLLAIRGITKRRLDKLRPYIFVPPAASAEKR